MIDVELVGLGPGPMDLAVWMVYRSNPEWRRKYEPQVLQCYYDTLTQCGEKFGTVTKEKYTFEMCKKSYGFDGAQRLCFYAMFAFLDTHHLTVNFENGCKAFYEDHGITPENIPPLLI